MPRKPANSKHIGGEFFQVRGALGPWVEFWVEALVLEAIASSYLNPVPDNGTPWQPGLTKSHPAGSLGWEMGGIWAQRNNQFLKLLGMLLVAVF